MYFLDRTKSADSTSQLLFTIPDLADSIRPSATGVVNIKRYRTDKRAHPIPPAVPGIRIRTKRSQPAAAGKNKKPGVTSTRRGRRKEESTGIDVTSTSACQRSDRSYQLTSERNVTTLHLTNQPTNPIWIVPHCWSDCKWGKYQTLFAKGGSLCQPSIW